MSIFYVDFSTAPKDSYSFIQKSFRSDFYSITHILSGSMSIKLDMEEFIIKAGSLLITSPHRIKQIREVSNDCIIKGLSFTNAFINNMRPQESFEYVMDFFTSRYTSIIQLTKKKSLLINKLLGNIERRVQGVEENYPFGMELLANNFFELMYEMAGISKQQNVSGQLPYGRKEELVLKFNHLVRQHHIKEHQLLFYSKQLYVTPNYLSQAVKSITGKTAGQIIDMHNVTEARRLLEESDLSVSEITYRLQFSNPPFFSRFFKRLVGTSPKSYRAAFRNLSVGND